MVNDFDKYNEIVGLIENCVYDISEILINNENDSNKAFQEMCFRLSIFALEVK